MDIVIQKMLKRDIGMTNGDIGKLTAGVQKMLVVRPVYSKYRMVAEVIESKYCFAGLNQGDKYVFSV